MGELFESPICRSVRGDLAVFPACPCSTFRLTVPAVKNYMFRVFLAQKHKGHEVEKHKSLCPSCLCAKYNLASFKAQCSSTPLENLSADREGTQGKVQ